LALIGFYNLSLYDQWLLTDRFVFRADIRYGRIDITSIDAEDALCKLMQWRKPPMRSSQVCHLKNNSNVVSRIGLGGIDPVEAGGKRSLCLPIASLKKKSLALKWNISLTCVPEEG
jgi:hypothetical protein